MKGLYFRYGCLFLSFLVATAVVSCVGLVVYNERQMKEFEKTGWTPRKVERVLKSSPPPGSMRVQVERWLASQPFKTWDEWDKPSQYIGMASSVGLEASELGGIIFAEVPDPHVEAWGYDGSTTIVFYFDKRSRLIKHQVRVWIAGL